MFDIIQIAAVNSGTPSLDAEARRAVRSNAMRHFKRMQKQARGGGKISPDIVCRILILTNSAGGRKRAVLPTASETSAVDDNQTTSKVQTRDDRRSRSSKSERLSLVAEPKTGSCLEKKCQNGSSSVISQPAGAAFYRYLLAETFGSSLVGPGARRVRSAAIIDFRMYVANTGSDIMRATDDSLCLMWPACRLNDRRILLEGRKRHLAGIECMRKSLEEEKHDIDNVIASAIELIFVDVFKPTSLGVKNLYAGVVYLVHKYSLQLRSQQTPVTIFLLIQLRQMMLLQSLAARTPLPVEIEMWQDLGRLSTLPEMTEKLMQLAVQLPDLLNTAHKLLEIGAVDVSATERALSDHIVLERNLVRWQIQHSVGSTDGAKFYHMDISQGSLSIDNEEWNTECNHKFEQMPFLAAQRHAMLSICLLALRESMANLFTAKGQQSSRRYYAARAAESADTLCGLAERFMQEEEKGSLSKALSMRAPLHFARQWYQKSDDLEKAGRIVQIEAQVQREVPFLSWESLFPLSLVSLYMLG